MFVSKTVKSDNVYSSYEKECPGSFFETQCSIAQSNNWHRDYHYITYCIDIIHCVSKNDNDVLRYNFNAHQPILIIFGRDIAE